MWDRRYNDLWLWPMPGWFVRFCNRFGETRVLDVIFLLAIGGLICGALAVKWHFLVWGCWLLLAPTFLLLLMMVLTAQIRRIRAATPEGQKREQQELECEEKRLAELRAKKALVKSGQKAYCDECGGELRLATLGVMDGIECDKGCTKFLEGRSALGRLD